MSILPAQIVRAHRPPLVMPFSERHLHAASGTSGGLSGSSYDIHVAEDCLLYPGRFVLLSTVECFRMPCDVSAVVHDKSTLIRRGISVHNTYIDAGWEGYLTLEVKNQWWHWVRIRSGQPIAQVVFHRLEQPTVQPYQGKYQAQTPGVTPALRESLN